MSDMLLNLSSRRLLTMVLAVLALALVVLLALPAGLPSVQSVRQQEVAWELPVAVSIDSDSAVSVINQRRLWAVAANQPGGAGLPSVPVEEKALTPADWRIRGVYTVGDQRMALLAVDGEPVKTLGRGDLLPGGAKIVDISPYRLTIQLGRQRLHLSTYQE